MVFFLFAFVRIRTIEDVGSSSLKMMHRQASIKRTFGSSSSISSQRDSIASSSSSDYPSSTSDSSLDSRRSSNSSSSETQSHRRPSFVPNRHSFAKMMGTIKDLPQKVSDEVQMPSFRRRQSGNKMKRSQSTSQVILREFFLLLLVFVCLMMVTYCALS